MKNNRKEKEAVGSLILCIFLSLQKSIIHEK
jgi:hypothetical protein